ncbi:hypothetical protein GC194_00540 [bacterium]|nr:hypothetical protein [bacterium]
MIGFSEFVHQLRQTAEVHIGHEMPSFAKEEQTAVAAFLQAEYTRECLEYPANPPAFCSETAVWAARLVAQAAYFYLNRHENVELIEAQLTLRSEPVPVQEVLSADLCLRFLPQLIKALRLLDSEDPLVEILIKQVDLCSYTALLRSDAKQVSDELYLNPALRLLALDRLLEHNQNHLLAQEPWRSLAREYSGMYEYKFLKNNALT